MKKICEYCSNEFNTDHPNRQKYCNRKCYLAAVKERSTPKIQYIDLKPGIESANMEEIFDALIAYQDATHGLSQRQDRRNIKIDTKEPIYVACLADIHVGAVGHKAREFRDTIEVLSSMPNTYIISCGDTTDNFLPTQHSEGQFEAICPPEIQKRIIEYMFGKLEGRILALIQGDHDEFSHITDDFDWTKYLCEKFGCPDLGFGGFINLTVGEQTYVIHARHRFRFSSQMNLTHTVKRMREQLGDFDIGVVAHNHQSSIEFVDMVDKTRVFVRPGSFKGADRYARKIGFMDTGRSFMPIIELHPKERVMNIYPDIHYLKYAKGLNDEEDKHHL